MVILPLIPLLYVGVAVVLSWLVMRWIQRRSDPEKRFKRWSVGALTFVVLLLLPTWNLIVARLYMYYLCGKEGGVTVYRTVELPEHYFNEFGTPVPEKKFIRSEKGSVELSCFDKDCYERTVDRTSVMSLPPGSEITRVEIAYKDTARGETLAKGVSFAHSTWYSWHGSAAICPPPQKQGSISRRIFIRVGDHMQGGGDQRK